MSIDCGDLTADYDYHLPEELIAQRAVARGRSRLLCLDRETGAIEHASVQELPERLEPDDLLVLNDTRVIPARLELRRPSGRRFELLLLESLGEDVWDGLLRPSAKARKGESLLTPDGGSAVAEECLGEGRWRLRFEPTLSLDRLESFGHVPLPPYIRRNDDADDRSRYQTVFAARPGAVAAPTAGLHFDDELLAALESRVHEVLRLTLHVGLGTFRPVSVERIADHRMHAERYKISERASRSIASALAQGRRIVCVGTTSVRALESATTSGSPKAGAASTELFITPGYEFRALGGLMTNFHTPRSSLLMMVSAFTGRERLLAAYEEAIAERYRFLSYGDAMLIL